MNRTTGGAGIVCLLLVASICFATPAGAQQAGTPVILKTNAATIEIGGRVQTQLNTTSVESEPATELLLRRARLDMTVQVNEIVSGRIQPEFAGSRVTVRDAYLRLHLDPGLQLLAGQAHRPFSLLELTSSVRMLPIERGLVIRGVDAFDEYELVHGLQYSDRDVGLQLMGAPTGAPLGLTYRAGVFAGPLQGRSGDQSSWQAAARATIRLAEQVVLGAGWSSRDFSRPTDTPVPELERGNAFEVDLELGSFSPGFHLLGEVAIGDFDPFLDERFLGAQAWIGYRTPRAGTLSAVEPTFRISYGNVDRGGVLTAPAELGGTLLTPGLNLYFGGWNRIMLNYDVWAAAGDGERESSFKAQFQLAF